MKVTWHCIQQQPHGDGMMLALALWLCVSPFVFLVAAGLLGWQAGLAAVALLFFVTLILCWVVCLGPAFHSTGDARGD